MTVATYRIDKNLAGKKLNICVGDQMTMAETESFVKEFRSTISTIDTGKFELHIDGTNMKVLTQEMAERLSVAMGLYHQAGFEKIVIEITQSTILKMQVSRIMRQAGLTNAEVITK